MPEASKDKMRHQADEFLDTLLTVSNHQGKSDSTFREQASEARAAAV